METWAGFCPGLHLSIGIWVMTTALTLQNAKAEITCASCPSPVQLHLEKLQMGMRTDPTEEPSDLEFKELGVTGQNTRVDDDHEADVSVEDVPMFPQHVSLDGVRTRAETPVHSGESHRGRVDDREPELGDDAALRRAKRSGPEFAEFSESRWTGRTGVDAGAPEDRGSLFDGQKQGRSDFGWNRNEGRGNTRQDEPKITSSTFALTGDSAHNHAVVYWSGQNSSVILILTKLYDFHIGSVTESTLWRSPDYGSTYERMNDKVGSKIVLSYLYVCPTNKRKVEFVKCSSVVKCGSKAGGGGDVTLGLQPLMCFQDNASSSGQTG